jgi:hypothetical protein
VVAVGVVEETLASTDPGTIAAFVGNRTVYSIEEIERLCTIREVLAIRFRWDRSLTPGWSAEQLRTEGIIGGTVQSISSVREVGLPWIRRQLEE